MLGLDTTAIIDFFKGDPHLKKVVESSPLATNILSVAEVHFGIDPTQPAQVAEAGFYEEFFAATFCIPLSASVCKRASHIHGSLRKRGRPIGKIDCLIAACYLENGISSIVTRNQKHFEGIEGLEVIGY